ncbi:MAG: citrate synthase/methylcitrate synthase [Chloroflexota bacterium]
MNETQKNRFKPGLEGVIAAETKLSRVDGQNGELIIAGYPLEEIAPTATFEAVVYLLWHGERSKGDELDRFSQRIRDRHTLPKPLIDLLRAAAAQKVDPMDALRIGAGAVDLDQSELTPEQAAVLILSRLPTIVAAYDRLQRGEEPIEPDKSLSLAANFLYMLFGNVPSQSQVRALETYFNTVIDHGLNASTFATRVIIATQSDMVSAVTGGIGALKGPLHGGAPGPALDMVFEIGSAERAELVLREKLDRGERLMGFGHRVYKVRDPRAEVLGAAARRLYEEDGDMALYHLVQAVEEKAVALLAEYKPGRNLQTNVEFYTALLLHGLGLEADLFSPTFAIARAAGWMAHAFEQLETGRLIRPKASYVGPLNLVW